MSHAKTSVSMQEIQRIVGRIIELFHPQKVILFGSFAYGSPHEGSDVDLLVVVTRPVSRDEAWAIARELGKGLAIPLQLIFMTVAEFEETKDVVGGLAYPAHHWGKVLYEQDPRTSHLGFRAGLAAEGRG